MKAAAGKLRHSRSHRFAQVALAAREEDKMRRLTARLMGKNLRGAFGDVEDPFAKRQWADEISAMMKQRMHAVSLHPEPREFRLDPGVRYDNFLKPMGLYDPKSGAVA